MWAQLFENGGNWWFYFSNISRCLCRILSLNLMEHVNIVKTGNVSKLFRYSMIHSNIDSDLSTFGWNYPSLNNKASTSYLPLSRMCAVIIIHIWRMSEIILLMSLVSGWYKLTPWWVLCRPPCYHHRHWLWLFMLLVVGPLLFMLWIHIPP